MGELIATRAAYGRALAEIGDRYPDVVVIDADISKATQTVAWSKRYPKRHLNFGIAEQNMMAAAAGLAAMGKTPMVNTYAVFAAMRACEQLRTFVAYPKLNVKIVVSHGGLAVGWDGVTHQGTEDMSVVRAIPNVSIVCPADAVSTEKLLPQVIEHQGPVYFRLGRNPIPVVYDSNREFQFGKAETVKDGKDAVIFATGIMVSESLKAVQLLESDGLSVRLVDIHTVKPLDEGAAIAAARETGAVVTAEDNNIFGGLGSAVAEVLSENLPTPLERIGVRDTFGESGDPESLFDKYQMSARHIAEAVKRVVGRKR